MDVVRGRWVKICRWFVESSRSEYVYEWVSPGNAIRDLRGRADIGRTKEKKITMGTDTSNLKQGLGRGCNTPVSRTNNICWENCVPLLEVDFDLVICCRLINIFGWYLIRPWWACY